MGVTLTQRHRGSETQSFDEGDFNSYPPAEGCPRSGCTSRGEAQRNRDTEYRVSEIKYPNLCVLCDSALKQSLSLSFCVKNKYYDKQISGLI